MSIAEFPGPSAVRDDDFGAGSRGGLVPPQDEEAEQSVLGAMLLSKDAIADVVEVIRGADFYRPAHELIYEAVLDLYGRGEPVDAITVSAELTRAGDLARVGGGVYIHTLVAGVPVTANAGYYAGIVREKAILRRLVSAGTKIVQLGYAAQGQVDDVVDRAQAEVYSVTDRRAAEDYAPLSDIMELTIDELEAIGNRDGAMAGVPTGFAELDDLTNGLHAGQMVIVAARPAVGKALALDTPLPTPSGWTTMGTVAVGDNLLGADGRPTRVIAATDVLGERPCYEIEFSDGTTIVADARHQWVTTTRAARRAASERRPTSYYYSESGRARLQELAEISSTEERVTTGELVEEVGAEFRNIMHLAPSLVGSCGRDERVSSGPRRHYHWGAPVYAKRPLLRELLRLASRPKGSGQAGEHDSVVTTEQIAAEVRCADGRANHAVMNTAPLQLSAASLEVPPYTLGAWLGDGHSAAARLTSFDPAIPAAIEAEGVVVTETSPQLFSLKLQTTLPETRPCLVCGASFTPRTSTVRTCGQSCGSRVRSIAAPIGKPVCPDCGKPSSGLARCQSCRQDHGTLHALLRKIGVLNNKHIPPRYLRASEQQRRALLAGLLDTDGTVTGGGGVQFCVTNRRLADDTYELIVSLGYRCQVTTKVVAGRSPESSTAYLLNFSTTEDVFRLQRKAELHRARTTGATSRIARRYITRVTRVTSVPVRCVEVDNVDHLYLAGRAMVPTHNSTIGLDIARSASIRHGLTSCIFSLEMSRTEITMRLLSAEARIPLNHMRNGKMSDDDWNKLVRKMGEVSEAPLFIDDSPNLTMMEIRAKARRLKQRHDLRLIIVDYLQLMTSGKKVESRQVEVSEFSRQIKLLAKELEVPVVAISQLNRGSEQRTSKRPLLSDLRESGCLTAGTMLLRADTNTEVSLGDLLEQGMTDIPVWSLDDRLKLVPRTLTHAFPTGRQPVYRMRLTSGREIEATATHRFLTVDGWQALSELVPGARIAAVRHVPQPLQPQPMDLDEIILRAHEKFVPAPIFGAPKDQVALFLRHLWATDGSVRWDGKAGQGRIYYASTSRRLVDDIALLLLRFNIFARIKRVPKAGYRDCYHLLIYGAAQQQRFLEQIGVHGQRGTLAQELLPIVSNMRAATNLDTVPKEIWVRVREALVERQMTHQQFAGAMATQFSGSTMWKHAPRRERLSKVASVLGSAELEMLATNDVYWDAVAAIQPAGEQDVYDATVLGTHNFIANGVAAHNSLEQDADMVILLHREDMYEKESTRPGEADLIVAKHRNGPTADLVLAFQGHYSRFVDMAQS